MPDGTIEDALKITLEDYRLSRGEKRALAKVVEKIADDDARMAFARNYAFKLVREELNDAKHVELIGWLEGVIKALQTQPTEMSDADAEAYFSPDDGCVQRIIRLFQSAKKAVDVCVFTITDDRITDAIVDAHQRGVDVRVISDNDKSEDLGSDIKQLIRLGVPVRVDQSDYHMHHKYAVFDRNRLLTGSYNWTRSAALNNEENFIVTGDGTLVRSFRTAFERLWSQLK